MKKMLIVTLCIIILLLGGIGLMFGFKKSSIQKSSMQKIEERLSIKLDGLVSIIQTQELDEYGEEHITAKLLINEGKRKELEKELKERFREETSSDQAILNCKNICPWWDMNEEDVVIRYEDMVSGKKAKTVMIAVYIVETEKDYIYISY